MCQKLRLALSNLRELVLKSFGDTGMKRASWLTQKSAVCCVLNQSMFEKIGRVGRHTLSKKQTGRYKTAKCRLKLYVRLGNCPCRC